MSILNKRTKGQISKINVSRISLAMAVVMAVSSYITNGLVFLFGLQEIGSQEKNSWSQFLLDLVSH